MPNITLRTHRGKQSPDDLTITVQDKTYDYLMSSPAPTIRVSAYFDRDCPRVEKYYPELFVHESCPYLTKVTRITPGSRVRKDIELPGPMDDGEQLVIEVSRMPASTS